MKKLLTVLVLSVMLTVTYGLMLSGCGAEEPQTTGGRLMPYTAADSKAAAIVVFPPYVTSEVQDAYEFALAHPDVLRYLPCYCGCGGTGAHTSGLDCFIEGVEVDGRLRFESHASFCDICLEIARDAERLLGEGKTLSQVRTYIDQAYSDKGPPTDTPWPPQ